MGKNFYLTTTLPYVNANLHMGHALEFVRADAIVRHKKLMGFDVFFNTGTDEHGMKIFEKAKDSNKDPQQFVDENFLQFKKTIQKFGMLEEKDGLHYIRTTDKNHIKGAQEFWKRVNDNGYIYKKNYKSKYCVGCEETKTDSDLVSGKCPIHSNREVEIIEEENYFFKYSEFRDKLLNFYKDNPNFIVPDFRFNEMKSFVNNGLQDFSISRLKEKMPWGIEVPGDPDHVMYVWFDALTSYINSLNWLERDDFDKYWVNGNPTQYCGKDNTRFQGAMWQAMLMAAGLPNSHQIIVNGFITAEGGIKMSKTLGNVVDPIEIVDEYGTDALRYFLLREISSFEDSPFTKERFKEAYNSGLANGLGNLVSRVLTMAENYKVSTPNTVEYETLSSQNENLANFDFNGYMNHIWALIQMRNKEIQDEEPYKKYKSDPDVAIKIVSNLCTNLYEIAVLLKPVMPDTAEKIINYLHNPIKKPDTPLFLRKD